MDNWNSGLIQIITNNGTLSFQLHDSRLDQYNLNGAVWFFKGDIFQGGSFRLVDDPSTSIYWNPTR